MHEFLNTYSYFAADGITATSANYIANIGKEYYRTAFKELENVSFCKEEVSAGQDGEFFVTRTAMTADDLMAINDKLQKIYSVRALIAWLREAIKTRERMFDSLARLGYDDYCKIAGLDTTSVQSSELVSLEETEPLSALDTLDADSHWRNILLKMQRSNYGRVAAKLRNAAAKMESCGNEAQTVQSITTKQIKEEGLICTGVTAPVSDVEMTMQSLKDIRKEIASHLSASTGEIQTLSTNRQHKLKNRIKALNQEIKNISEENRHALEEYKIKRKIEISRLRIVIPEQLKPVYDLLSSLGGKESQLTADK